MAIRETMTIEQAAVVLCCNPATVRALCRNGELKGFKIGKVWRISESAIEKFIEQGGTK